jgi:hypothetical protein
MISPGITGEVAIQFAWGSHGKVYTGGYCATADVLFHGEGAVSG